MSSNVGQNYPYTSESMADREHAVEAVIEAHPELVDEISAETTPLEPDVAVNLRVELAQRDAAAAIDDVEERDPVGLARIAGPQNHQVGR